MAKRELTPYEKIDEVFGQALELSTADETELLWLERRHGRASSDPEAPAYLEPSRLTVLVRVVQNGRVGWHRTESGGVGDVEIALRQAMALATTQPKARRLPVLPTPGDRLDFETPIFDPEIAGLTIDKARRRAKELGQPLREDDEAILRWGQTQIAVVNNHGLARMAEATEISLLFRSGKGPGAGWAAGSARALSGPAGLPIPDIVGRARSRATRLPVVAPLATERLPLVLSAEAVAELLNVLNIFALAGRAYLEGTSFLARHRNVQVFDQQFHLRDDARALPGMPFPFDFEGMRKRPLDLIVGGKPSLPALSQHQSGEAGLEPTAQSVGGQDALFGNLFLHPGQLDQEGLLKAADGGIFIGWLDRPECYEPNQLRVRALARGARRIEGGKLGAPLPDLVWDESLLHAFARLRGIGNEVVVRSMSSTPLGAIAAPMLVLEEANKLDPVKEPAEGQTEATALALLPPPAPVAAAEAVAETPAPAEESGGGESGGESDGSDRSDGSDGSGRFFVADEGDNPFADLAGEGEDPDFTGDGEGDASDELSGTEFEEL